MSVKIYSTPTCPYCSMAKDFMKSNNVSYEEFNVATDLKAREEMFGKSHQMGVPVLDINGEIVVGFNRPEIERILNIKS